MVLKIIYFDTDELIELATAKKTRDQQREKFRQINHKIATLKYSEEFCNKNSI